MELKTLTWNIGGGKLLQDGADPLRIASYAENGLDAIAGLLESEGPDVIALQETQRKEGYDQVELIASSLGYEHYFHDSTSESHIDTDCRLGHCVIFLRLRAVIHFHVHRPSECIPRKEHPEVRPGWQVRDRCPAVIIVGQPTVARAEAAFDDLQEQLVALSFLQWHEISLDAASAERWDRSRRVSRPCTNPSRSTTRPKSTVPS
jgi:Endonuclease/Exonuclease/phosphatase family